MIRPKLVFGLVLLAGASLSACGKKGGGDALANDPFTSASTKPEDRFGKEFGKAYRAEPNSEPANVQEGDMVPVSRTTEPVQID